jgi:hypothetical protein
MRRFFLLLLGGCSALGLPVALASLAAAGAALGGCGTTVSIAPPTGGTGGNETTHPSDAGAGTGGEPADAAPDYVDPGCPDAGPKVTMFMCDPYHQGNGDCPPGEGCYIFSTPPSTPCGQEVYGAGCDFQGMGQQGAPCEGMQECAGGFACVVSGSGNQCVLLCELQGSSTCPDGLVCEPIDVQGFGGCL